MARLRLSGTSFIVIAQALRIGVTLVTANVAEFGRVPGLDRQDWTAKA